MTIPEYSWFLLPTNLALSSDEVHVLRASLDVPTSRVHAMQQILTADELNRAARFCFQKDRQHFIVARGLLRSILGRYLDMEPNRLRFCYGDHGKPVLVPTSGQLTLRFNLSHSGGVALYAVTYGREIGIDLERVCVDFQYEQIAARFFSLRENTVLRALPTKMRPEAFLNCWTRKEAYIKAKGEGLSLPLDQFDVSLAPGELAALLNTRGEPQEASRWSLQELNPGPGFVAALAVEGHGWRLACWQWPD